MNGPPADARLWVACPLEQLSWVLWEDGCALFHRPSGQTHFVNAATFSLLTQTLRTPRNLPDAGRHLAALQGEQPDAEQTAELARVLVRLEELGLVQALPT